MKKFLMLVVFVATMCQMSYAAIDEVQKDGVRLKRNHSLNFTGGLTASSVNGVTIASIKLPYYSTSAARPASGGPRGSIIMKGGVHPTDCGATAGGPYYVVCVADGTNWKAL